MLVSTAHYFPEPARQIMRQMTVESRTEEDWRVMRAIPRSYLWIVPNGGHGPIFGDMAQPFLDAVSAFLESRWER